MVKPHNYSTVIFSYFGVLFINYLIYMCLNYQFFFDKTMAVHICNKVNIYKSIKTVITYQDKIYIRIPIIPGVID